MQNVNTNTEAQAPETNTEAQAPVKTPSKGKRTRKTLAQDHASAAQALRDTWVASIALRVGKLQEKGQHVAIEWALISRALGTDGFTNALAMLIGSGAIETDTLTRILPNTESKGTGYVQAKTVQKIVNMVHTLAANDLHKLSDYTSQVLYAALHNGDALSIAGAQASLCKRLSAVDLPNREQVTNRANYTVGTASAQASQVREVFRILGLATVEKGKRGDTFTLNGERVGKLRDLYALTAV